MTITCCQCYVNYEQFNGFDGIHNVSNTSISKWQPKIVEGAVENTNQLENSSSIEVSTYGRSVPYFTYDKCVNNSFG